MMPPIPGIEHAVPPLDSYFNTEVRIGQSVVIGLGMTPKREEVRELRIAAGQISIFEIGDSAGVAKLSEAFQQGYMAAMSII